jgi:hypothetical protein
MIVQEQVKEDERLPVCIGCDVGQIHDPSAICVTEVAQVDTGRVRYTGPQTIGYHDEYGAWIPPTGREPVMRSEYTVKQIRRLPLNTSYPDVAIHLADMLMKDVFKNRKVRLLIDVTGVGRPVYDTYGAKIGKHDDLATAAGLSCLEDPYNEKVTYSERVY